MPGWRVLRISIMLKSTWNIHTSEIYTSTSHVRTARRRMCCVRVPVSRIQTVSVLYLSLQKIGARVPIPHTRILDKQILTETLNPHVIGMHRSMLPEPDGITVGRTTPHRGMSMRRMVASYIGVPIFTVVLLILPMWKPARNSIIRMNLSKAW